MRLIEKIQGSFSAQLSLWVAGFVIVISAVVIILLARFSGQVIRDELIDITQQTLQNTAQRMRHAIRQSEIIAQLEHKPFAIEPSFVESLLEEHKPRQYSQIRIIRPSDGDDRQRFQELNDHGEQSYRFCEPIIDGQYSLEVIVSTRSIYSHFFRIQAFLLTTGVIGVLLLLLICGVVIVYHLRPLRQLAATAQRIAGGHLDEPIRNSNSKDEIGRLQNSLSKMQRSLRSYLEEIRRKQSMLSSQNASLQEAYSAAQEYDELKRKFISEMTQKMSEPVALISQHTNTICSDYATLTKGDMAKIQVDILSATGEVTHLLDELLNPPRQVPLYDLPTDNPTAT